MTGALAAFLILLLLVLSIGAALYFHARRHGWPATKAMLKGCFQRCVRWTSVPTSGGGPAAFSQYVDPAHQFSFLHPADWSISRAESPQSSVLVQATCAMEESYKRLSVAFDDVSWSSTTPESYGRNIVANLEALVPGSKLVSHGFFSGNGRRGDSSNKPSSSPAGAAGSSTAPSAQASSASPSAYLVIYTISDALDPFQLHLTNLIVVSLQGGRRRAYTITFACESHASEESAALCRRILDSFRIEGDISGGQSSSSGGYASSSSRAASGLRGNSSSGSSLSERSGSLARALYCSCGRYRWHSC